MPDPGQSYKLPHKGCSSSKALKVTNTDVGFLFHCFKCGESLFVEHEDRSYRDRKRREAAIEAARQEKERAGFHLPADFSQTIAPAGLAWLGSGGWTNELILKHRVGWSDRLSRVVFPLDIGWQARAVIAGHQPKYLSKYPTDMIWRSEPIEQRVCLVEDILSAGRVGQIYPSVAILGTEPRSVMQWIGKCREVVLWFDNDDAGRKAAAKVKGVLQWIINVKVNEIRTANDPKTYETADIIDILRHRGGVL
jgi:hypothetical protein